jgi:hypothetical protein
MVQPIDEWEGLDHVPESRDVQNKDLFVHVTPPSLLVVYSFGSTRVSHTD